MSEVNNRIFISRTGKDGDAATWAAGVLESHGYECVIQDRDFRIGERFPLNMLEAFENCATTLAIMSPDYWASPFCRDEWAAAYALDRSGEGRLIPVMLQASKPPRLNAALSYLDLTRTEGDRAGVLRAAVDSVVKRDAKLPSQLEPDTHPFTNSTFYTANFTGRPAELKALYDALWGETGAAAITAAVHGLGGVGKSAIAMEYASRFLSLYAGAWTIRAEESSTLKEDLADLARRLDPRLKAVTDLDGLARQGAEEARALARTHDRPFLILLDNIETPGAIPKELRAKELHLIVTSRYGTWGGDVAAVEISELPPAAARELLLRTANRAAGDGLDDLLEALSGLPLALVQAGAYLRENPSETYAAYTAALERRIREQPDDWDTDQKLVAATFGPSILQAEVRAPGARDMLMNAAYYAPDSIPLAILVDDPEEEAARKAADALKRFSLAKPGEDSAHGPSLSLHRLLQAVLRADIPEADRPLAMGAAAKRLRVRMMGDPTDVRTWPIHLPLAPHTLALNAAVPVGAEQPPLSAALGGTGELFRGQANNIAAEHLIRRALAIDERSYGPDHPEVAVRLNNLATFLHATNRLQEAEPLMRRALAIDEKSYGPDHSNVAIRLNNLAGLLQDTNRLQEAEPLMRRALAIDEKSYGPDHPRVAIRLNNLALLLEDTNRLQEAEPLMRRALAIGEKGYGPDHPSVAIRLSNLAVILQDTNRQHEAEPLMRRALDIDEKSYGPDHPRVAIRLNNLATLLRDTGRLEQALPLMRRAVAILQASLPVGHPWVEGGRANLAAMERDARGGGSQPD